MNMSARNRMCRIPHLREDPSTNRKVNARRSPSQLSRRSAQRSTNPPGPRVRLIEQHSCGSQLMEPNGGGIQTICQNGSTGLNARQALAPRTIE